MSVRKLPDVILIFLVLLLVVAGQILAKFGSLSQRGGLLGIEGFNILLAGSYIAFLFRGALWAWVLRRNPINRVYPYLSLAYPLILAAGISLFSENLSIGKIAGTLLILGGSILINTGETE